MKNIHIFEEVMGFAGLTSNGPILIPERGRISTNGIVQTREKGPIVIRVRQKDLRDGALEALGYYPGRFVFEPIAINHYSYHNLPVPQLLSFGNEKDFLFETPSYYAYAYSLIEGHTVEQAQLSKQLVGEIGSLLNRFFEASETFESGIGMPDGDIDYIVRILRSYLTIEPSSNTVCTINTMISFLLNDDARASFEATPSGLVHADLFYENIVLSRRGGVSIIDFGDVYYGKILMDVTTSAMEFAYIQSALNIQLFSALLTPLAIWFAKHNISFDTFHYSLLANCARFAAHTLRLSHATGEKQNPSDNDYVKRFYQFQGDLRTTLETAYMDIHQKAK
jgi:hypothetical protein